MSSLWKIGAPVRSPRSILEEQANLLTEQTQGRLVGEVGWKGDKDKFLITLRVRIPALNDYRYVIKEFVTSPAGYPVKTDDYFTEFRIREYATVLKSEPEFLAYLQRLLGSEETAQILAGLLSNIPPTKG